MARGARRRAPCRAALERDDHVRSRRSGRATWARHLLRAREQQQRSGGFTEFVPLPFVPMEAPIYLKGRARRGPTLAEALLVHAVGRLALHPWITNIQASWVKLGPDGVRQALAAGVNDLGGTLMNESISRAAGSEWGQEMPPERMEELIRSAGRVPRQRTTLYDDAPEERVRASFGAATAGGAVQPEGSRCRSRGAAAARPSGPARRARLMIDRQIDQSSNSKSPPPTSSPGDRRLIVGDVPSDHLHLDDWSCFSDQSSRRRARASARSAPASRGTSRRWRGRTASRRPRGAGSAPRLRPGGRGTGGRSSSRGRRRRRG